MLLLGVEPPIEWPFILKNPKNETMSLLRYLVRQACIRCLKAIIHACFYLSKSFNHVPMSDWRRETEKDYPSVPSAPSPQFSKSNSLSHF